MRATKTSPLELDGRIFGAWIVVSRADRPNNQAQGTFWLCRCRCGATQIISGGRLNAGRFSRGCMNCRSHGGARGGLTPEYQSWRGMRERCTNPNHVSFQHYGGRGIKVCDQWLHSFECFREDMGPRPKGHSLDRINADGNYEPDNCRWADHRQQAQNTREQKLTDEQVDAIQRAFEAGAMQRDIAVIAGVSRSHISNICRQSPKRHEIMEAKRNV